MGLQKDWDRRAGRAMWAAGRGDAEIAKAMGVTQGTISYYRRRHWERECDAAPVEEEQTPAGEFPTSADVEVPEDECQADEEIPTIDEITMEVNECEQEAAAYVPPSKEGSGSAKMEDVMTGHIHLIDALEAATCNLTGMDAVMTAQIIAELWGWTDKGKLLEAKACLDYLIRRHDHE